MPRCHGRNSKAQLSAPRDLLSPEGTDPHPFLSSHSILRKPILPALPTSEALTCFLPGPLSQPRLTEAAPSRQDELGRPIPTPPASAPRTEGVRQGLSRAPGLEQACPTNTHRPHFTPCGGVRGTGSRPRAAGPSPTLRLLPAPRAPGRTAWQVGHQGC